MFPTARSEQLTVQELPEETLVFDHVWNKAHCLNRTTASIWKHCDGRTSPAELARLVEGGSAIVELALEQLAGRHLLQGSVQLSGENRRSRRDLLKKLAAAAVALPVILTVAAPRANAAASKPDNDTDNDPPLACTTNADCSSLTISSGCTQGQCVSGKCTMVAQANGTPCGSQGQVCSNGVCVFVPA